MVVQGLYADIDTNVVVVGVMLTANKTEKRHITLANVMVA